MPKAAQNLYEVLNVSPGAQPVVIEAAYRALMKRYHPDHAGTAEDAGTAVAINHAYAVLRDPERRAQYDRRVDHDRRDLAAQRHARIVALQGGPVARSRVNWFGWSGWLVAAVACGVLATVPRQHVVSSVSDAAFSARAGMTSQPAEQLASATPEDGIVEFGPPVRAPAQADVPLLPTAALAAPLAADAPPSASRPTARAPRASRQSAPAKPNQQTRAPATRRLDAEFLEREGYIY